MKKNLSLFFVLLVLIAAAAFIFVMIKPAEKLSVVHTITADDGNLSLSINDTALPKHITPDKLSIKRVEEGEFPLSMGDGAFLVYDLAPGGLVFLEPVDFSVDVPVEEDMVPVVYNFSEYGISRMNNVTVTLDPENGMANISGTTKHFSYFYIMQDGFMMKLSSPEEAHVGQAVTVTGTTVLQERAVKVILASSSDKDPFLRAMYKQWQEATGAVGGNTEVGELKFLKPWELKGTMTVDPAGIVAPEKIDDAPARRKVKENSYKYDGAFTCTKEGKATFTYAVKVTAQVEMKWKITPPFDISMEDSNEPMTIIRNTTTECKVAVDVGDGIGLGGGGGGNGEKDGDGDGDDGEEDAEEEDEGDDGEELEEEGDGDECPDCEALEEMIEELEEQIEELEDEIDQKDQELKNAEFTEDLLDQDLRDLVHDAGCDPAQGGGAGATKSGESSGTVTSRGIDFFCPNQAAAEAMIEALKEFWKNNKSPSQIRHELDKLREKLNDLFDQLAELEWAFEDCPCVEPEDAAPLVDFGDDVEFVMGDEFDIKGWLGEDFDLEDCEGEAEMQILELEPETEESVGFHIGGDIPSWIEFDPSEGTLPQDVKVSLNCDEAKKLPAGQHKASPVIEVTDEDDNKIKAIAIGMLFGVRLVDESELSPFPPPIPPPPTGGTAGDGVVMLDPPITVFVYDHANPTCPLPIDPVNITGPGGDWTVTNDPPIWLDLNQMSGSVPGTIEMSFPCQLDRYENQTQMVDLPLQVTLPDGTVIQESLKVEGEFKNF